MVMLPSILPRLCKLYHIWRIVASMSRYSPVCLNASTETIADTTFLLPGTDKNHKANPDT